LALTFALMLVDAYRQGIWIDEIWSLWMSETGVPLPQMLHQRWLTDAHPPLFHALNWVFTPVTGLDIFLRRLLNIIPAIYTSAILLYLYNKSSSYRSFVLVFAAIVLTSRGAIWYFPEHRSYFSTLSFSASLFGLLYAAFQQERPRTNPDWMLEILFFVTTVIALNFHYISTVILGSVLGAAALVQIYRREWRWVGMIVLSTIVAFVPLVVSLLAQAKYLAETVGGFWIQTTLAQAVKMLVASPGHTLGDNVVAAVAVVAALFAVARSFRQKPPPKVLGAPVTGPNPGARWFVLTLLAGLAFAAAVLAAGSFVRPMLVPRYLIATVPLTAAMVAAMGADLILSRRLFLVLFCVNAAALAGIYSVKPLTNSRWEPTIDYIRAQVRACPTTRVYGLDTTFFPDPKPSNEPGIQDWGYQAMGRLHGFQVAIILTDRPAPATLSETCPTLLWAEHVNGDTMVGYLKKTAFAQSPEMRRALAAAKTFKGGEGIVIDIPPTAAAGPATAPYQPARR
jgi:hypothetical protein